MCEELQTGWYVEGWAIPDLKGMRLNQEHGWVELPDGSIIDPTYADPRGRMYYAAVRYAFR